MRQLSYAARLFLFLHHLLYAWKGQQESIYCRHQALHGQPQPEAYIRIRALFDSLRYAYAAGARVFSYEGLHDFVLMFPPQIPEPYTGTIDFGGFLVMTEYIGFAQLIQQQVQHATYHRYGDVHVLRTGRFTSLDAYVEFLHLLNNYESAHYLGKAPLYPQIQAIGNLCARYQQPGSAANGNPAADELATSPEDRLVIDVDSLNHTLRRQDSWL